MDNRTCSRCKADITPHNKLKSYKRKPMCAECVKRQELKAASLQRAKNRLAGILDGRGK